MQLVLSHKSGTQTRNRDLSRLIQSPSSIIRYFDDITEATNFIESQTIKGFVCHTFPYGQSFQQKNIVQQFNLVA